MHRDTQLKQLTDHTGVWDMIIIGGGATGVGVAVDAASRGYSVCLLERRDFGIGTSSRSTKLIHGGVRYLQQGNIPLVIESLHERGLLRKNAPHLVEELPFIIPNYAWWERPFYGIGMKVYDILAGRYGFNVSKLLSKEEILTHIPTLEPDHLNGGTLYYDGQFDDARLLINLVTTAIEQGATVLNYMPVQKLTYDPEGTVNGVVCKDSETGTEHTLRSKCVINATGPFTDAIRKMNDADASPIMAPSQGVHIVLDHGFLTGDAAIMVPHTNDGRVMFAIPWRKHTLIGTTDTPLTEVSETPAPLSSEIDFILETAAPYFAKRPTRSDIRSAFAGIRPLARNNHDGDTASLSRDFVIDIAPSGLLTITGGKWTTYRKMAEECIDHAIVLANLTPQPCITKTLNIHGHHQYPKQLGDLHYYGSDALLIQELMRKEPHAREKLHPDLDETVAEVIWAVRHEMARTVDDLLSRRLRLTFLDIRLALEIAPAIARIMATELKKDATWEKSEIESFTRISQVFLVADLEG